MKVKYFISASKHKVIFLFVIFSFMIMDPVL